MSPQRRPLGLKMHPFFSPGDAPSWERWPGILVPPSVFHLFWEKHSCVGCKATTTKIAFNPQFIITHGGGRKGFLIPRNQRNPIASSDLLLPAPALLPGATSESPLCVKGSFSSRCCGDRSFRFHQARPHFGFLWPPPKNKATQLQSQGRMAPV